MTKNIIELLVNESNKIGGPLLRFVEHVDRLNLFSKEKLLYRNPKSSLFSIDSTITQLNTFLIHQRKNDATEISD